MEVILVNKTVGGSGQLDEGCADTRTWAGLGGYRWGISNNKHKWNWGDKGVFNLSV